LQRWKFSLELDAVSTAISRISDKEQLSEETKRWAEKLKKWQEELHELVAGIPKKTSHERTDSLG
jgi:hypothetical protein